MTIFIITSYLISLYFLYKTLIRIYNISTSIKYIKHHRYRQKNDSKNINKKILILIPVYKEYKIIENTIEYFKKICKKYDIAVYFISTSKEGNKKVNKTFNIISKKIDNKIKLIHYPFKKGHKAHQLNFAIDILIRQINKPEITYIAVFDADSKPDFRAFDFILNDSEFPIGYQMCTIYSENFDTLNDINKANAIFQSQWSLSFEMPRIISNYNTKKTKKLIYFIGHGVFLRLDTLIKKKIPEDSITEDIALGYTFAFENIVWKPVPYFDYSTVPTNILSNIIQTSRWFYGELFLYKIYINYVKNFKITLKSFFIIVERYFILFQWLLGTPTILFLLIYSFLIKSYFIIMIILLSIFLYIFAVHKKLDYFFSIKPKYYLFILIKTVLDFLGPLYGLYRFILKILNFKDYEFIKTER